MRIWSIHPKYLDRAWLLACWRETLLAKACLSWNTRWYVNHPQLIRFKSSISPLDSVLSYLKTLQLEAVLRWYNFDVSKAWNTVKESIIPLNKGQLLYEWKHFLNKIYTRDYFLYEKLINIEYPDPNPVFFLVDWDIEKWEKLTN